MNSFFCDADRSHFFLFICIAMAHLNLNLFIYIHLAALPSLHKQKKTVMIVQSAIFFKLLSVFFQL